MIRIAQVEPEQIPVAQELLREYAAWSMKLVERSAERVPTFHNFDSEIEELPGIFSPPSGRLLIAEVDGRISGSIALKRVSDTAGELKRLYVRPESRGLGLGRKLVAQLIDEARTAGYRELVLDSHKSMLDAHKTYRQAGFEDVEAPADFPEWLAPQVVFMRMSL